MNGVTASGPAHVLFVQPPTITPIGATSVTGASTTLTIAAYDLYGGSLSYLWNIVAEPSGARAPTLTTANADTTTDEFFQAGYTFQVVVPVNRAPCTQKARKS